VARALSTGAGTGLARALALAATAVGVVAVLGFARDHHGSLYDDAFIYLRYAANLLAGCGPTFTCGEPAVEGFTSPLFLGLLVLGGALGGDLPEVATVLGVLGVALTLALVGAWSWHVAARALELADTGSTPSPSGAAAGRVAAGALALGSVAALALDHYVLLNAVSGLETSVAAAAIAGFGLACVERRARASAALAVLAVLLRPEAGVFVVLLPALSWCRRLGVALGLGAGLLALVAARWLLFDDIAPNTYWAKVGGTWAHARLGAAYLADAAWATPLALAAPLALLDRPRRREHAVLVVGMAVWAMHLLRTGGDHFLYGRLVAPIVPLATAMGLLGVALAARALLERAGAAAPRCALLAAGAALAFGLASGGRAAWLHRLPPQHGFDNVGRWAAVGRWLAQHHPTATIATVPVGAIAYTSGLPTIDLVGITDRVIAREGGRLPAELVRRHWIGHERHHTAYVWSRRPDLIVLTKFRERPWTALNEAKAGFYSEWLLLQDVKAGRVPYRVASAEVLPGVHWLLLQRAGNEPAWTGPR